MTENIDLFEKKFSILEEISRAIVATDNINTITNLMLELAINYTSARNGSLMLINDSGELSILAFRGISIQLAKTHSIKIGEGIAGYVAKHRVPILVKDIEKDGRFYKGKRHHYKTKSFISCPIISKDNLIGVLNIHDKTDGTFFTEDEFSLLKTIANQAAIALENAMLMNQLKAKASDLAEMNAKLIDSDIVKTEFLTRVSHELRTPLNSIKGAIFYLNQSSKIDKTKQSEFYEIIASETNKLTSIVENQLDFLRLDDETRIIKRTVINIKDLIKDTLSSNHLSALILKKNIRLNVEMKMAVSDIIGDKIRLAQVFINLIEALCNHAEEYDTLKVTVEEDSLVQVNLSLSRKLLDPYFLSLLDYKNIFKAEQSDDALKIYLAMKVIESHRWTLKAENLADSFVVSVTIPKISRDAQETVIHTTMEMFVDFFSEMLGLNKCSIMLLDELTGELRIKGARGLSDDIVKKTRIRLGDRIAGWVALEGKPLLVENIEDNSSFSKTNAPQYNTKSLLSVPLKIGDKVIGVLNLNNKKDEHEFNARDVYIASAIGERISHFVGNYYSGSIKENDFKHFISSFENLLSAGKKYLKKGYMIQDLTMKIMAHAGAGDEDKKSAVYVSTIYDLGLGIIDNFVLDKKQALSSLDVRTLRMHTFSTLSLIDKFEFSEVVKKAIYFHHERYDGQGYPDGLKGENIPLISRVIAVVDSYCAMLTEKSYRKARTKADALQEIRRGSGSLYDPNIVEALEKVLSV